MLQAPKTERIELFKWRQAFSSMNEAMGILRKIKDGCITHDHPLHHALWSAFHVFYAKPFKQHAAIKIGADLIPTKFENEHRAIITLRDKLFAHSDLNGPNMDDGDLVSTIYVSYHPQTIQPIIFGIRYGFPAPEAVSSYEVLVTELLQVFHDESARIFNSWIPYLTFEPYKYYRINIGSESDDVLIIKKVEQDAPSNGG